MIDRRNFKNEQISLLGFGTMRLPCKTPLKREANPMIDYAQGQKLVDYAFENGINYFDTAFMYHAGKSEKFIGMALKKYPRDSYYLADKLPIWMCPTKKDMERVFKKQLSRTGQDYFDFYLLHSLNKDNYDKCEKFEAYDFLMKKKMEGKIKNIGFSFHGTIEDLERIVSDHKWDFAQIQFNYLDYKNQNSKMQYEILTEAGIPVIVMEPVRGGKLADVTTDIEEMFKKAKPDATPASWAMSFVASFDNVLTILSGMNSIEQLSNNIETFTDFKPLNDREMHICANAAAMINRSDIIPCTGCDYCAGCPKDIKISSIFAVYNDLKTGEYDKETAQKNYEELDNGASSCIRCQKCADHCPQALKIPELLQGIISETFEINTLKKSPDNK